LLRLYSNLEMLEGVWSTSQALLPAAVWWPIALASTVNRPAASFAQPLSNADHRYLLDIAAVQAMHVFANGLQVLPACHCYAAQQQCCAHASTQHTGYLLVLHGAGAVSLLCTCLPHVMRLKHAQMRFMIRLSRHHCASEGSNGSSKTLATSLSTAGPRQASKLPQQRDRAAMNVEFALSDHRSMSPHQRMPGSSR